MADRKRKRTSNALGTDGDLCRSKSRRRKKQNKGRLMFCIASGADRGAHTCTGCRLELWYGNAVV